MGPVSSGDQDCLSDDVLVKLSENRLHGEELERAVRHAEGCIACHDDIASVVHEPWEPPAVIDELRIERELGRGGMGVVYLAHDTALDRKVAIKFIAEAQPRPRSKHDFENEARLLARLQHPNIVTVFRVGQVEGHPYIVSEYIMGHSLAKLRAPVPWPRALELGLGLARGLAAAHRQGVLHRDIKPSNAIETVDGVVKLLDFGLAERIGDGPPGGGSRQRERTVAGTPAYMAPEALEGAPATPRSDLYSLGVVLHELCTGWPSPDAPTRIGVSAGASTEGRDASAGPAVDQDLRAVIQRCIRTEPDERFASADLLVEALERLRARVPAALPANPYRGLAPFEAEHQALFFGRDADSERVLERLRRQQLVLIVADSGVGKSSLCRAGILPRVATGAVAGGQPLATRTLTPGRRPLQALGTAFAPAMSFPEAAMFLGPEADPRRLGEAVRGACERLGGVLLFVDQLEELVTLSDPGEAACFTRTLGELVRPGSRARLLLAVRGDFFTRVAALPGLEDEAERALHFLRPMTLGGLREAIVGPARACGVAFESDALVRELVESAAHGPGELPLLSFALTELWERRDVPGARIHRTALDEVGGVAGLLSRHADSVVARLDKPRQQAARRLLIRLVTAGNTRNERTEDELDLTSQEARAALRALVDGRLLQARTVAGRACYQIAHDALIQRWALLRNWLDDDIGHRAVRQRLEAAGAEWDRLGRPPDLLWRGDQLEEARPLDRSTLGAVEKAFLEASSRRVKRRRLLRGLAAALAVVAVALPYGSFRLQVSLADARFVDAHLATARQALDRGHAAASAACVIRREALELFDGSPAEPGASKVWGRAEGRWAEALRARNQAVAAFRTAEQSLQSALGRDARRPAMRRSLLDVTWEQLALEECFHPQGEAADEVLRLLQRFDDDDWRERITAPAELRLVTEPAGAQVEVERYGGADGRLSPSPAPELSPRAPTPVERLVLPPGSYRLRFVKPGRAPVVLPVLVSRGARDSIRVPLPASVPEGFAFIPPGCYLQGSDYPETVRQGFLQTTPLHRVCMNDGYLISKTEITFGDWLEYLEAEPESPGRNVLEKLRQGSSGRGIALRRQPGAGWVLSLYNEGKLLFAAGERQEFRYRARARDRSGDWRRLPLSGVSAEDLQGYFSWLARAGRVPGARLCTELEWERAAGGADGRAYPHGDRLSADDANFDVTYGREPDAYGPDMAGAHPASQSPFGLSDMAGNVLEMTVLPSPDRRRIVLRGGGWYYSADAALIPNRMAAEPTLRDSVVGGRVCADYPAGP